MELTNILSLINSSTRRLKGFTVFFLTPANGISVDRQFFYVRTVAWVTTVVCAFLITFGIYYDVNFHLEEFLIPAIVSQHIFVFMPFVIVGVALTYVLKPEKLYIYFLLHVFSPIPSLSVLAFVAEGVFVPMLFPFSAILIFPAACIMPLFPIQLLMIVVGFWFTMLGFHGYLVTWVDNMHLAWVEFNLLFFSGIIYTLMHRIMFDDLVLALNSQKERIDELTETQSLLNISLDANQFGLIGFDNDGNISLQRGASLENIFDQENHLIKNSNYNTLTRILEKKLGISFDELLESYQEFQIGSSYYVLHAYKLKNLTILSQLEVTKLRKMEAELRARQKLAVIGEITSGVAHNYNNTLAIALSNLEAIPVERDQKLWKNYIEPSIKAIGQSAEISHKLLAMTGRQNLSLDVFDISNILHQMEPLLRSAMGSQIALEINADDTILIKTDRHEFESAILNLVINARNAIDAANGKVKILAQKQNDLACVRVIDNGHGIAPSIQEKVFDPFFSTGGSQLSAGLGLSTVKGFVEQSNGYVRLKSEPKYTEISLYFPICHEQIKPEELTTKQQKHSQKNLDAINILLVDDNLEIVKSFSRVLLRKGFNSIYETSPIQALKKVNNDKTITHALIDLSMPEMDGITLGQEILKIQPHIKLYMITGETTADRITYAKSVGFVEVFLKPIHASVIADEILRNSDVYRASKDAIDTI